MRMIVVGCGRVGVLLTTLLESEQHQVTVIDKDASAFRRLPSTFHGRTIAGVGFDRDVLREAGIERVDALAAVTSGDNSNFITATVARDTFRVPTVVARIYDPQREQIYRRLGIHTISSTTWGAHRIKNLMLNTGAQGSNELGNGEVELLALPVPALMVGRTVRDVAMQGEIAVFAVLRDGRAFVPTPGTVIEQDDTLHLSVLATALGKVEQLFR